MGLFTRKIEKHKELVFQHCIEVLAEDDRVYRNQVDHFSRHYASATPSGHGLLKARLFGASFPAFAFLMRWGRENLMTANEVTGAMSGLAVMPLEEPGSDPSITHEEAMEIGGPFIKRQFGFITDEMGNGPSSLRAVLARLGHDAKVTSDHVEAFAEQFRFTDDHKRALLESLRSDESGTVTDGFLGLINSCHEAFVESVGEANYSAEARHHFGVNFGGGVNSHLGVFTGLFDAMR